MMAGPNEIDNDDIKRLTDVQLVRLLWTLLNLELDSNGIEKYDSHVPLSIYVKDGGIDGLVEWDEGPDKTDYLPGRVVGFQAKATDMSAAACTAEVRRKEGTLKSQVRSVLEGGGLYVLFLARDCVGDSRDERINALRRGIEEAVLGEGEKALAASDRIYIYDATDIAGWVNNYPAAITAVNWYLRKQHLGVRTWEEMSEYRKWANPYVSADEARDRAIDSLRNASSSPQSVVRVVGASGLGKTRLVLEAFRPPEDPASDSSQSRVASGFCYVSAAEHQGVDQLLIDWRRRGRRGVVVVDDCTFELHERLSEEVTRADSKLALITIGNDRDPTAYAGTDTKLIAVNETSNEAIASLLDAAFPQVSPDDRSFIANELAQGYPLMAILVAEARKAGAPLTARLSRDVLAKLLGGDVPRGSVAEKVISVCSLFEYLGVSGDAAGEREFARSVFCPDVSPQDFYAKIVEFEKCGALSRYGRLVQVRPRPLAVRLAADWWERCTPEFADHIIQAEFPEALAKAFCDRLRMLDFVPALVDTAARLCGPQGPFGQAKVLSSELGSRLFRAIAEVNPVAATQAISVAFEGCDNAYLRDHVTGEARRNLVWALEKLCFRSETFSAAARFLSRLAAGENETWSNNATGVFARLFRILLSATQAPLEGRFPILRELSTSADTTTRRVAITALKSALQTHHFVGTSGPEFQGSAGPLPEYRPRVWKEVFDYWSACLRELTQLAASDVSLADEAAAAIAHSIRGLILQGRLDDVEAAIQAVAVARKRVWPDALDSVKDSLRFDAKGLPAEARQRLESWLHLLEPDETLAKIELHVTRAPYEHVQVEDHWRDLAAERAEKLGNDLAEDWDRVEEFLPMVLSGPQQQAFAFGRGLAKGTGFSDEALAAVVDIFGAIVSNERNAQLVSGWLAALDSVDRNRCDRVIGELAERPEIQRSLPKIFRGLRLNEFRIHQVIRLLREGRLEPADLIGLSYGQAMSSVSADVVSQLCMTLASRGAESAWIALDIGYIFVLGAAEKKAAFASTLKRIIAVPGMLSNAKRHWRVNGHAFAKSADWLVGDDEALAANIASEAIAAGAQPSLVGYLEHCVRDVLASLLRQQASVTWPLLTAALSQFDHMATWQLGNLLRGRVGRPGEPGMLEALPLRYLSDWCARSPDIAPKVLARIVQAVEIGEDGRWTLTPAAKYLVNEHGKDKAVLSELAANLGTFSWCGSLVPYYQGQASLFSELTRHPTAEVSEWAKRQADFAAEQVKRQLARDAEQQLGRY